MKQTVLIRSKILKLIQNLRIYISCLPDTEMEALQKLQDPEVHLRIADYALNQLGADVPIPGVSPEYFNKTKRAIAKIPGVKPKKRRYRKLSESWNKPKDVPRVSLQTSLEVTDLTEETKAAIAAAQPSEAAQQFNHETQEAMLEARAMDRG